MPLKYPSPKRCSLQQAAIWFADRTIPLPEDIFRRTLHPPADGTIELRDLFAALLMVDCGLMGNLLVYFGENSEVVWPKDTFAFRGDFDHSEQFIISHDKIIDRSYVHMKHINFSIRVWTQLHHCLNAKICTMARKFLLSL
jgi:hypothetical protein